MKKVFHLFHSLHYTEQKTILRKFYLLPYFHLNVAKIKVQSVVVINLISVRIILYFIVNLSARLLVECTVLEVACLVTAKYCLLIYIISCKNCRYRISTIATSRLRKICVVLPDILTTNVVIVTIVRYFSKNSKYNL